MPQGIDDFTIILPELTDMAACELKVYDGLDQLWRMVERYKMTEVARWHRGFWNLSKDNSRWTDVTIFSSKDNNEETVATGRLRDATHSVQKAPHVSSPQAPRHVVAC
jgi:hypothetical protein